MMYIFGIILIALMIFRNNSFLLNFKINCKIYMFHFIDKLKPLTINLLYNSLYCFSCCQIFLCKIKNHISPRLTYINSYIDKYLKDKGWIVDIVLKELIIIDNDGNEIYNIHIKNNNDIRFIENECKKIDYSGFILSDKNAITDCVNDVFYEKFPVSFDYKVSNIKFISMDLDYADNKYMISLKDNEYNYYIVNNCLNKFFFKYYIKNVLKLDIKDPFDYNITIIDNNINIFNLLSNQSIIINENDYKIYNIDDESSNGESDKSDNSGDYINIEPIK